MSDEADRAYEVTEKFTQAALAAQLAKPRLKPRGYCHNPDCELDTDTLFCSVECRDDYDRMEAAAKRAGRRFP